MPPNQNPLWQIHFKDNVPVFQETENNPPPPQTQILSPPDSIVSELEKLDLIRASCDILRNACLESLHSKDDSTIEKMKKIDLFIKELQTLILFYQNLIEDSNPPSGEDTHS